MRNNFISNRSLPSLLRLPPFIHLQVRYTCWMVRIWGSCCFERTYCLFRYQLCVISFFLLKHSFEWKCFFYFSANSMIILRKMDLSKRIRNIWGVPKTLFGIFDHRISPNMASLSPLKMPFLNILSHHLWLTNHSGSAVLACTLVRKVPSALTKIISWIPWSVNLFSCRSKAIFIFFYVHFVKNFLLGTLFKQFCWDFKVNSV